MKKSLFAMAAVTAFAGAAQAQSSVTVYGVLDVGYIGANTRGTDTAGTIKQNQNSFGTSAEQSSRIGFKGTEDLGGGMSAFFTLEQDVNVNSTSGNITNNRQAFVGLAKKGLGQSAIGMQYMPIHTAVGKTDPGQQNNMPGSVIYPTSGNTTANAASGLGSGIAYTVRAPNSLTFTSDKFAGFSVNALASMANKDTTQETGTTSGGNTNTTAWGIGADYSWKKLYVTAAYQSVKGIANNVTTASTGSTLATTVNATSLQGYVAATYDFGILKAYVNYINRKDTSNLDANNYLKRTGQQIGVRSFVTPKIEAWANIGNGAYQGYGASQPTQNFTAYQVGSNYWLSKRTNLYGIYGSTQTSSGSSNTSAYGSNAYAVGLRHTF